MGAKRLKIKAFFQIFLVLTLMFFSAFTIKPVMASEKCCEKTVDGAFCVYGEDIECDPDFQSSASSCEQTSFCRPGCCYDLEEGICHKSVSQAKCLYGNDNSGEWSTDVTCSGVSSCQEGCCVLGSECSLKTFQGCALAAVEFPEIVMDFHDNIVSETECQALCASDDKGCCVKTDGSCSYGTREECEAGIETTSSGYALMNGSASIEGFYAGLYCSNIEMCDCDMHADTVCDDEDVYWLDSCGNLEDKAEDCDYASGTICKEDNSTSSGGARCVSVNCESTYDSPHVEGDGGFRKNGESWCSYDSAVGPGYDLVGSRHYRHMCVNGEEIVEPCKDFREEFCFSMEVGGYSESKCKTNRWKDCATKCYSAKGATSEEDYNAKLRDDYECCNDAEERDCFWTGPDSTSGRCIPLVPPGFKFWPDLGTSEGATSSADSGVGCNRGDTTCKVYFYKPPSLIDDPDWECVQNCECLEPEFVQGMATVCRAMGDCGAYYNIECDYTDSGFDAKVDNKPECSGSINDRNFDVCLTQERVGPCSMYTVTERGLFFGSWNLDMDFWDQYGGYVPAVVILAFSYAMSEIGPVAAQMTGVEAGLSGTGSAAFQASSTSFQVAGAVVAGLITAVVTYMKTGSIIDSVVSGGVVAACMFIPGYGLIVAAIAAIVLNFIMGDGETDEVEVVVDCKPWEAPTGGDKCELCTDQEKWEQLGFDTCSLYKCRSLGQNCRFIPENEGTGHQACYSADPNDVSSPVISPWPEILPSGYSLNELSFGYEINPEIAAFTRITFGIQTNEISQCKISEEHTESFESMANYFGDDNLYKMEHQASFVLENGKEFEFYVRCQDPNGNANAAEYVIKMKTEDIDLMAPIIEATEPENYAYISHDTDMKIVRIFVNEPANCKYSTEDLVYEGMEGDFKGDNSTSDNGIYYNYQSYMAVLNVSEGQNDFYFRCQDLAGNTNQQSYHYVIYGTPELNITFQRPNGTIYDTISPQLLVSTIGGAENGAAVCSYTDDSTKPVSLWPEFYETGASSHTQQLTNLTKGNYEYHVICEDVAGNRASTIITFTIDRDTTPPELEYLYVDSNTLHVILNEKGSCQYGNETFSYGEGQTMSGSGTEHQTLFVSDSFYHIICSDVYNNPWEDSIVVYL